MVFISKYHVLSSVEMGKENGGENNLEVSWILPIKKLPIKNHVTLYKN